MDELNRAAEQYAAAQRAHTEAEEHESRLREQLAEAERIKWDAWQARNKACGTLLELAEGVASVPA